MYNNKIKIKIKGMLMWWNTFSTITSQRKKKGAGLKSAAEAASSDIQ